MESFSLMLSIIRLLERLLSILSSVFHRLVNKEQVLIERLLSILSSVFHRLVNKEQWSWAESSQLDPHKLLILMDQDNGCLIWALRMRTTEIISSAIENFAAENDRDVCNWPLCWWQRQRCQLEALLMTATEMSAIESFTDDSYRDVCNWKLCWWQRQRCLQLKALLMTTTEMSAIVSFADDSDRGVCNWKLCWWQRQRCHFGRFTVDNDRDVCNWKLCWQRDLQSEAYLITQWQNCVPHVLRVS